MFRAIDFGYEGRNGHHYMKTNTTAAEIRRIYKRVKPTTFNVWLHTDEGFVTCWSQNNHISLQARSINYIGIVAERYNGITKIGCYPYEYTNC